MTPSARPARHKAWMLYQLYCVVAFLLHMVLAWGLWRVIQDPYPVGLTLSPNDIEIAQYAAETLRKGCIVLLGTSLLCCWALACSLGSARWQSFGFATPKKPGSRTSSTWLWGR